MFEVNNDSIHIYEKDDSVTFNTKNVLCEQDFHIIMHQR